MIERRILIGLIVSTDYCQRVLPIWDIKLIQAPEIKRIAVWAIEYFKKYNQACNREIETIFYSKANTLPKDIAQDIEEDILPSISEEYDQTGLNIEYLFDETITYFNKQRLIQHANELLALAEGDRGGEAETVALNYKSVVKENANDTDFSDPSILEKIKVAFATSAEPLISFPGVLGQFWNHSFVRGGFVAIMAPEKRGKTFMLLELALRARKQKRNVAFFQAGDMTENEQIVRTSIYLAKKSNKPKYCGKQFQSVADCVNNQLDKCDRQERLSSFGCFAGQDVEFLRKELTLEDLKLAKEQNEGYKPCHACEEYTQNSWGVPWIQQVDVGDALEAEEAQKYFDKFFIKNKRHFKLSTHPNSTLSVKASDVIMSNWEKQNNFQPDVIVYDYPDIMVDDNIKEFRHKQNQIWKDLRAISQKRKALVIVVTQTDADAYKTDTLSLSNFSEDKRKYGHVTAMYGLNQDKEGREKKLGLVRINEIIARESDFDNKKQVYILQNLSRGRPFLDSFW